MKAWRQWKSGSGSGWGHNHRVQKTVGSVNRNDYFGASSLLLSLFRRAGIILPEPDYGPSFFNLRRIL